MNRPKKGGRFPLPHGAVDALDELADTTGICESHLDDPGARMTRRGLLKCYYLLSAGGNPIKALWSILGFVLAQGAIDDPVAQLMLPGSTQLHPEVGY